MFEKKNHLVELLAAEPIATRLPNMPSLGTTMTDVQRAAGKQDAPVTRRMIGHSFHVGFLPQVGRSHVVGRCRPDALFEFAPKDAFTQWIRCRAVFVLGILPLFTDAFEFFALLVLVQVAV